MSNVITRHVNPSSLLVIVITFALFTLALLSKGFNQGLFLEAGVFLVSVKLLLGSYRDSVFASEMRIRLDNLDSEMRRIANHMTASPEWDHANRQQAEEIRAQVQASIVQAQPVIGRSL